MKNELTREQIGHILQYHVDAGDPDTFVVGKLLAVFPDTFLVLSLSPYGEWDGLALYPNSDLVALEEHTAYIQRLETLLERKKQQEPDQPELLADGLETVWNYARKRRRIAALELFESGLRDVVGFPAESFGASLCLNQVDEDGKPDGVTWVCRRAVTRFYLADRDLCCRELLARP